MPNTREKLIELLQDSVYENVELDDGYVGFDVNYDNITDHLIANGVTVQEWISVKDRLPAVGEDVLVITSSSNRNMAVWRLFGNAENRQAHWEDEVGDGLVLGAATHWMPLPQPAKGD